jgi:predicted DNA-binding protein YlxM (UPF0122 family)
LERLVRTGLLYDFYGGLLTDKQRRIMNLYYNEDWTMVEIAEKEAVSRQAIYDLLHRSEHILENYESKLGLMDRFLKQQGLLKNIITEFDGLLKSTPVNHLGYRELAAIKTQIDQLIAFELEE